MSSRVDTSGHFPGLDDEGNVTLARLSARALEGRSLAEVDEREIDECTDALEALAWPTADTMQRVALWLGAEHSAAHRRAQRLCTILEACGTVVTCADPAQAGRVLGALRKLSYHLGSQIEQLRAEPRERAAADNRGLLAVINRSLENAAGRLGLLLVHCGAVDKIDAARGLHAGDALVAAINEAVRRHVLRPSDSLAQVSRDEYACILTPMPSEGVAILAAQKILRVLDAPLEVEDFATTAEASIGIALLPDHGHEAGELVQYAKAALRAARSGRERIAVYSAAAPSASFDESRYAARLRHAIDNNALSLFYQAQADFHTGRLMGAEALLRWNDEVLGTVAPNVAVSVAESAGMMNDLTLWVINRAIQQCAAFRRIAPEFTVSINISPSNLHEADLPAYVGRALRTWSVDGGAIVLEVTETAILTDQKLAIEALEELKRLGVKIAIDDFGTGYSSMYYLAQMPLDELKIDVMFVRQMLELPQHAKIVRSLIELAHNLELSVVAEGVEDEPIWSALSHLGCDRAQGWFVAKPVPAADLLARLGKGLDFKSS